MKMMPCKKCGAMFDLDSGECPNCGALYYIVEKLVQVETPPKNSAAKPDNSPTMRLPNIPESSSPSKWRGAKNRAEVDSPTMRFTTSPQGEVPPASKPLVADTPNPRTAQAGRPQPSSQSFAEDESEYRQHTVRRDPQINPNLQRPQEYAGGNRQPRRTSATEQSGYRRVADTRSSNRNIGRGGDDAPSRRRLIIVGAVGALAVLIVVICALSGVFKFGGDKVENILMPAVVGKTRAEAVETLSKAQRELGLQIKYEIQNSDKPKDIVLEQSIKEKKILIKNEVLTLILSSGESSSGNNGEMVEVPNLSSLTFAQASTALSTLGLKLSKLPDEHSDTREGLIIAQEPAYSSKIDPGQTVYVVLSKGPAPSPSPTPSPSPSPSPTPATHTITVTVGVGGSVSPRGTVSVADGENVSFTITPDSGYAIREVKVNGSDVGAVSTLALPNVREDYTLYVVFQQIPTTPPPTTPPPTTPPPTTAPPTTPPPTDTPTEVTPLPDGNPEEHA